MCQCHCTPPSAPDNAALNAFTYILVQLNRIETRMEEFMATAAEQLNALSAKLDDLIADVRAALEALAAERENLTPAGQAALDALTAKVDAFDAEVGDADGSDTPPVEPPVV